jgi:hypothetical protein
MLIRANSPRTVGMKRIEGATMNDRNSLLDKVRALMSKTAENGCTEHEALAALDKARALILLCHKFRRCERAGIAV